MTVNSRIIKLILSRTEFPYVQIQAGKRLQVVPDFDVLPYCQKNQFAAFVTSHQALVVWEDDPKRLIDRAQGIQDALIKMIGGDELAHMTNKSIEKSVGPDTDDYVESMVDHEEVENYKRPLKMWQPIYTSIAILMLTTAIGSGWRKVAIQQVQDPDWLRLLFMIAIPGQACLSLVCYLRP
jgi:hypothetical protein